MQDELKTIGVGVVSSAAAVAAYEAWRRSTEKEIVMGRPARLTKIDANRVSFDADTFQFKSGGDQRGVTDRLKGVKSWDPVAAGKSVIYEKADGSLVIADGHQRLGLAKRLSEKGQNVRLDAYVMRERDGWSPRDVRVYAALKNIKESSGAALDMAKVMRERPDLVNDSLPMSDAKVREARALSNLSEPAFRKVASGVVKPEVAAAIGESVKDATRHADLLDEMAKAKVATGQHARAYVGQAMAAPTISETTASLFGDETKVRSLVKERAQVLDKAITTLKQDKRLFALLEKEAGTIESAGNKLAHDVNAARASQSGQMAALVEKLSTTRGPLSQMLDRAAEAVAKGEKAPKAARAFTKEVGSMLKSGGIKALMGDASPQVSEKPRMQAMVEKPTAPDADLVKRLSKSSLKLIEAVSGKDGRTVYKEKRVKFVGMSGEYAEFDVGKRMRIQLKPSQFENIFRGGTVATFNERTWIESSAKAPSTSPATAAQSTFLPEATTKDQIAAKMKSAGKPGVRQQGVGGLFGDDMKQMDLVDEARKAAPTNPNATGGVNRPIPATAQEIAVVERAIKNGKAVELSTIHKDIISRASNAQVSMLDGIAHEYRKFNAATDADFNRVSAFREAFRAHAKATADAAHNAAYPGWSDEARAASAEVRAAKPEPAKLSLGYKLRALAGAKEHWLKDGEAVRGALVEARDKLMTMAQADKNPATVDKMRAVSRMIKSLDTHGGIQMEGLERGWLGAVADEVEKVANTTKQTSAPKASITQSLKGMKKADLAKVAKELGIPASSKTTAKALRAAIGSEMVRQSHAAYKGTVAGQEASAWGGKSRVDRGAAEKAAKAAKGKAAAKIAAAIDKVKSSGLRGTQNPENLKAILENREPAKPVKAARKTRAPKAAKAPATPTPPPIPDKPAYSAADIAKGEDRWVNRMRAIDGAPGKSDAQLKAEYRQKMGIEQPKAVKDSKAPKASKVGNVANKAMKALGPMAIGGAAYVAFDSTMNSAKAAGASDKDATTKGVVAGAKAGGVIAAMGYGITKGMQATARVFPKVAPALGPIGLGVMGASLAYWTGSGAVEGYKKGGVSGAIKGAGRGVADWATFGAASYAIDKYSAPSANLTADQAQKFKAANANYTAMKSAEAKQSTSTLKGFANPTVQKAAQTSRGVVNVSDWAASAPEPEKKKSTKSRYAY